MTAWWIMEVFKRTSGVMYLVAIAGLGVLLASAEENRRVCGWRVSRVKVDCARRREVVAASGCKIGNIEKPPNYVIRISGFLFPFSGLHAGAKSTRFVWTVRETY